ncbi:MAG: hypothetical protein ACI89J_002938, partial [Hyphomicrobiaceae bacterium]
ARAGNASSTTVALSDNRESFIEHMSANKGGETLLTPYVRKLG